MWQVYDKPAQISQVYGRGRGLMWQVYDKPMRRQVYGRGKGLMWQVYDKPMRRLAKSMAGQRADVASL